MRFSLTMKSNNRKTGPIPVSTSPKSTCPTSCPLRGGGCYAEGGPLAIHWSAISKGKCGDTWQGFISKVQSLPNNQIWRHNQSGDLKGNRKNINRAALNELIKANKGKRGFTYTHYLPRNKRELNARAIQQSNKNGFTINLSANNLNEADRLYKMNLGPIVVVLPSSEKRSNFKTKAGNTVVVCPAIKSENITCASCQLCAKANRKVIVGFTAHGFRKSKLDEILR